MTKWKNVPHTSFIKDMLPAETLLDLLHLREKLVANSTT